MVNENFKTSINNSNSFTAVTIKTGKEVIVLDLENEHSKYLSGKPQLHSKEDLWCETLIMIPLFVQTKLIGLFSVQRLEKFAYSNADIELLKSLAAFIAVALNNAGSYTRLDKASIEISFQKRLIELKNLDITDSISYAKRIQDAKLPDKGEMRTMLPDSFILFMPKDIVRVCL